MKHMDAESVCMQYKAPTNRITLIYMCNLFGFMKELLQEVRVSNDNTIIYNADTTVYTKKMFADDECVDCRYLISHRRLCR